MAAPAGGIVEYHDLAPEFQRHYDDTYRSGGRTYDAYEPAYRFGYDMAYDGRFAGREFEASEAELRQAYYQRHGYPMSDPHLWADVRDRRPRVRMCGPPASGARRLRVRVREGLAENPFWVYTVN